MTGSDRPLRNHFWKRDVPSRTGGGENSGNALDPSNALNYRIWGIPAVLSRGIPGKALGAFPPSFRNFLRRKVPAVLGVWPNKLRETSFGRLQRRKAHKAQAQLVGDTILYTTTICTGGPRTLWPPFPAPVVYDISGPMGEGIFAPLALRLKIL